MDWSALWLSLKVSASATLLVAAFGFPVALLLARKRRPLLEAGVLLPLILPPTVIGYFLLVALGRNWWIGRAWHALTGGELVFTATGAAIAAAIAASPLFIRQAQVALREVDHELEAAARSMGATEFQVLRWVSVPLARRGLLSGLVLAYSRALGEFGATLMVAGSIPEKTQTLPLALFDAVQSGNDARAIGLAALLAAVAAFVSVVATQLAGRSHGDM